MALTAEQTIDMLADLAAGALDDVFSQLELDRFYTRAGEDYNLAVYYGWRQILADSAKWVNYRVAQTQVDRGQAFDHILKMVALWADESRTNANQVKVVGIRPVPTKWKEQPDDEYRYRGDRYRWRWGYPS
jgi:hypothetical protein